jgi:small conductance mechanosensitive channel
MGIDQVQSWSVWLQNWLMREGVVLGRNILVFLLVLGAGWLATRLVDRALRAAIDNSRFQPSPLFGQFVVNVARKAVWIVALVLALDNLGIDTAALIAGLGASGLVLGFALKDTLSNFASGALLLLYNPFDVGDYIEVAGNDGTVADLTLVNTVLHTGDRKVVTLPNSKVWGSAIVNYNTSELRRVDIVAGIAYGEDVDRAREIFMDILESHELVLTDPAPVVRVKALADSCVNFDVRAFVKNGDYWTVQPEVLRAIKKRLDEADIEIPFPQRDVWVRSENTPADVDAA